MKKHIRKEESHRFQASLLLLSPSSVKLQKEREGGNTRKKKRKKKNEGNGVLDVRIRITMGRRKGGEKF